MIQQAIQPSPFLDRRRWVVLVGDDSIVSRVLQVYLRKEGYEAIVVPDDVDLWARDESVPLGGAARPQLVIVTSPTTGQRRRQLYHYLREREATRAVPILSLLDAGRAPHTGVAGGVVGQPPSLPVSQRRGGTDFGHAAQSPASPPQASVRRWEESEGGSEEGSDASLAWPFRLREVLLKVQELMARRPSA